jgi:hypothetical protein
MMDHPAKPAGTTALRDKVRDKLRSVKRRLMRRSEGEAFLLEKYARLHGQPFDMTHPQRFSEKLFARMIAMNRESIAVSPSWHFRLCD